MFYEMAESGKDPTPFQLERLRKYELTSRINSVIFEGLDLATDIAFMLVLFDQAGDLDLPVAWQFYKATSKCPGLPPGGPDFEFYRNLGIASAVFLGISSLFRLSVALGTVIAKFGEIDGINEWSWALFGCLVSIVDPWNGSLMINQVIEKQRIERDDYVLAVTEVKSDVMLILLENVPQVVIQIIYGAQTGQANYRAIAWYVAIFFTVFHSASQLFEIFHLTRKLPELRLASMEGKGHVPAGAVVAAEE